MIFIKDRNLLNRFELVIILVAILNIGSDYCEKYSSYRSEWKFLNVNYLRPAIDCLVIGVFSLRVWQILRIFFGKNSGEVKRSTLSLMFSVYVVLILPDLYQYFLWSYYTDLLSPKMRLTIYAIPIVIWTYRMMKKQS